MIANRATAQQYVWGDGCDGWMLAPGSDLLVIEERMPPGTAEVRHCHERARQLFRVLDGELTMWLDDARHLLRVGDSIEIAPGTPHQARNDGTADVYFLVISSPTTRGDRIDLP